MNAFVYSRMTHKMHPQSVADALGWPLVDTIPQEADLVLFVGGGLSVSHAVERCNKRNITTVVLWVGEDVYKTITNSEWKYNLPPATIHVGVHDRLVDDLATIGVNAECAYFFTPRTIDFEPRTGNTSIATYIPSEHPKFELVTLHQVFQAFPSIIFNVYGNRNRLPRLPSNVVSHGYLYDPNDVLKIIRSSDAVLRWTRHDGLPQNIIEASMMGRSVISKYPYHGCECAPDTLSLLDLLAAFSSSSSASLFATPAAIRAWYMQNCTAAAFKESIYRIVGLSTKGTP